VVATVCVLAQACAPIPNRHYFAPTISGTVVEGDQVISGAEVRLTASFTTRDVRATTGADGQFSVGPLREMRWIKPLLGDPLFGFRFELKRGDRTYLGYVQSNVGYAPKALKLACDLSSPVPPVPRVREDTTYCRLTQ
jgi:hypothetical protein